MQILLVIYVIYWYNYCRTDPVHLCTDEKLPNDVSLQLRILTLLVISTSTVRLAVLV